MKVIAVYSGGLDSTVMLYQLLEEGCQVKALSVNYGQRHAREIDSARAICTQLAIDLKVIDLSALNILFDRSALVNPAIPIPLVEYDSSSLKSTVVPNRNMLLLASATAYAINESFDAVSYGAHAGDHALYPDCRPEFVSALSAAISLADWSPISLLTPFLHLTKSDICRQGARLSVPFAETWSCYNGGEKHCGLCGTCNERRNAFISAEITDPTNYMD